ncbi:MAG: AAA family ATPase [Muribaculaceae bacterium]|nr:AAA family ATPase [Muribaculaceae bacterium]
MAREYRLTEIDDIFGYGPCGWIEKNNLCHLFYDVFGRIPSVRKFDYKVLRDVVDEIERTYSSNEHFDFFDMKGRQNLLNENDDDLDDDDLREEYSCIMVCGKNLMFGLFDEEVVVCYAGRDLEPEVTKIFDICGKYIKPKEDLGKMFVVGFNYGNFKLEPSKINNMNVDVETNYNDDFLPVARQIEDFVLDDDTRSGLVVLHGLQGTGKTSYIRHLISQGKKKMIYMGGNMIDKLSDPSFVGFVRQQKNSVFIVEDCEELLASRKSGNPMNTGLVNILNISDGLLGDELCIKFICTFNAPLKDMDPALLRKGRLVARYEFKSLTPDKVNHLIEKEGLDIPEATSPMTLAEIYNFDKADYAQTRRSAGF